MHENGSSLRARRRVLGAVAVVALAGCASVDSERLEVSLTGLSLAEAALLEQRFLLRVRLVNPSGEERPIDGAVYELAVNGQPFARGVSDQALVVPRFGEAQVDWMATGTTGGVLRQVLGFGSGRRRITYRLRVRAQSGGARLHLEGGGEIDLTALAN
jgi:LEA14-like dessication related protein